MYDAKSRFPRPFCQKQIPSSRYLFTLILFFVSSGFAQELELGLRLEGPGLATLEWPTSDEGDVEISADLITWTSLNGDVVLDGAEELYQSPIDISRMDHFYFRLVERQPYSLRDSEEAPGKTRLTWWPVNPDELPKLEYREMPTDVWRPVEVTPTQMADGKWVIDLIGFPDGTEFRVAANAEPGIVPIPDTLIRVGQQGSVDVMAADPDGDRVSFQALGLPEGATFDPVTGVVAFAPRPTQVGAFPVTITVSDGFASVSESFDLTVPQPPQRETTTLRGQILDANMAQGGDMMPVANIAVTLLQSGQVTMTDAQGNFLLEDIPAGNVVLDLNPDTVLGAVKYAGFREELEVFPLIENEISRPLYLPRVAMESMTAIDPGTDTMVANTTIGVSLEVLAGSAMDQDNGGAFTGELSISEVPQGFTPAAMPRNLQPSMVVTIQPVGVMFAQPAPITFPNRDNLAPGSVVDLWSLDAGTGAFAVVGRGRVSADGLRIETIEGGMRNTDWHFPLPEGPDINPMPEDHGRGTPCPSGSIVRLHNGALETEVALPPFFSMGQRRQVTLRYSSAQHAYKARVSAIIDQRLNNGSQPRPEFLSFGASTPGPIGALKYVAYDDTSPISTTVAAEIPLDDKPSGVQPVTVEGTYHYADSSVTAVSDVWVNVVNRVGAPYGAGWSIGGVQRIFPDPKRSRVLLVEDTYSAEFQRGIEREGFDLFAYGKALPFPDSQGTRVNVGDLVNGDFNNDGALDIITADETNSTLRVFLGRGDGDFDLAVNVPALEPLGHLATADFDGDGALDLVAARDSVGTIYVYQGLGNGSFVLANTITSPILAKWLRVGEFDGQPGLTLCARTCHLRRRRSSRI